MHSGMSIDKARAKGAVVLELQRWGLGDTTVDPGEVLLRLVTQSAARVELLSRLLQEAYDAADRLKATHEAERLMVVEPDDRDDRPPPAAAQAAYEDLRRVFATGGVAALVGQQYAATKDGDLYATGEAIRGLAKLEAEERDRCANFAAKAVAAGLAERQVRVAERQGATMAAVLRAVLGDLGLNPAQLAQVPALLARHVAAITGAPIVIEGVSA